MLLCPLSAAELAEVLSDALEPLFPEQPVRSNAAKIAAAVIVFFMVIVLSLYQALDVGEHYLICHALEVKPVAFSIFMQEVAVLVREQ